jgi:hypothetical protein
VYAPKEEKEYRQQSAAFLFCDETGTFPENTQGFPQQKRLQTERLPEFCEFYLGLCAYL